MDYIATTIITAIEAGITGRPYQLLRQELTNKYGQRSEIIEAVGLLENKPKSFVRRESLYEKFDSSGVSQDRRLYGMAKKLQRATKVGARVLQFSHAFLTPTSNTTPLDPVSHDSTNFDDLFIPTPPDVELQSDSVPELLPTVATVATEEKEEEKPDEPDVTKESEEVVPVVSDTSTSNLRQNIQTAETLIVEDNTHDNEDNTHDNEDNEDNEEKTESSEQEPHGDALRLSLELFTQHRAEERPSVTEIPPEMPPINVVEFEPPPSQPVTETHGRVQPTMNLYKITSQARQIHNGSRVMLPPAETFISTTPEGDLEFKDSFTTTTIYDTVPHSPPVDLTLLDMARSCLAEMPENTIPNISSLPRGSRMPLEPNPLFLGRDKELSQLAKSLKMGETVVINQVDTSLLLDQPQVSSEFGGIGKTQLAVEFVHRYGQYFTGGVFWLNFADPGSISVDIIASGGAFASLIRADFRNLLLEEQMELVLSAWQGPLPRLLIFDNCEDPALLTRWLPKKGDCRILVTSRQTDWPESLNVTQLRLDVLSRADSISLLRQYRPDPLASDDDVAALAAALGHVPLALHLAGNFLVSYREDAGVVKYLEMLQDFDTTEHPLFSQLSDFCLTEHDTYIARTLVLSYEQLGSSDPTDLLAQLIILRAAFFAPNATIPRDLLLATLHHGSSRQNRQDIWGKLRGFLSSGKAKTETNDLLLRAKDALARLVMMGLLGLATDGALYLHPYLRDLLQTLAIETGTRATVRQTLLETCQLLKESGSPTALLTWEPHIRATSEVKGEVEMMMLPGPFANQMIDNQANVWEKYYYERALAINEQLMGENHLDTAQSLHNLGILAGFQADYISGRFYLERSLAIRLTELGEEHLEVAESFNDFGALLASQGIYDKAKLYYDKALHIRRAQLGENHPDTAQSLNNLGELFYQQEQFDEARSYFEQALTINEGVLGQYHPETARTLSNMGTVFDIQGDKVRAWFAYEEALMIFISVLGRYHPDAASMLNNLGALLDDQRDYRAALIYYEQALAIRKAILGDHHPDTATTLHNLAILFYHQKQFDQAKSLMKQALTIREMALSREHPHTKISRECLAVMDNPSSAKPQPRHMEQPLQIAA
ncbi:tetratricopeptide repeat protein [Anaerolineales bacterium HSG24]|nr:tetratricopeptide repeat protein [Anaerolineales bacterium HSG24]